MFKIVFKFCSIVIWLQTKYRFLPVVHKHLSTKSSLWQQTSILHKNWAFSTNCHKSSRPETEKIKWWLWSVAHRDIKSLGVNGQVQSNPQVHTQLYIQFNSFLWTVHLDVWKSDTGTCRYTERHWYTKRHDRVHVGESSVTVIAFKRSEVFCLVLLNVAATNANTSFLTRLHLPEIN